DYRFVEAGIGRAAVARSGRAASPIASNSVGQCKVGRGVDRCAAPQQEEVVAALAETPRAAAARRSGAAHAAQSARSRADIPGGEARVLDIEIGRAAIAIAASPAGRGTAACSAEPARVDGQIVKGDVGDRRRRAAAGAAFGAGRIAGEEVRLAALAAAAGPAGDAVIRAAGASD